MRYFLETSASSVVAKESAEMAVIDATRERAAPSEVCRIPCESVKDAEALYAEEWFASLRKRFEGVTWQIHECGNDEVPPVACKIVPLE